MTNPQKSVLQVKKIGFHMFGQDIPSGEALMTALVAHQAAFVEIHPDPDAGYEQIGIAIYTVARSGAEMKVIGIEGADVG